MDSELDVLALGTLDLSEAGETFRSFLRGKIRDLLTRVMAEEVSLLCGEKHKPNGADCTRAGTAPGYALVEGNRESIRRPRVRREKENGKTAEVPLGTYAIMRDPAQLQEQILSALRAGVPSREQRRLHSPRTPGVSKSEVSRLWKREGARIREEFRARDIGSQDWAVLMLDGIGLGHDMLAVVALGITAQGKKQLLDFEIGSSESYEVSLDLLRRLKRRGFGPMEGHTLFAASDGSPALKKAILKAFPGTATQRCLVHKEKNIRGYLPRRHWSEIKAFFNRLRKAEGGEAAREIVAEMREFLADKNAAALASLEEAGDDLIRLHLLGAPATLNVSLLSTNCIENPFRNVRSKIGRVQRWQPETDQPSRWLAYALVEIERGFRRIKGYRDLTKLIEALKVTKNEESVIGRDAAGIPLRATPSAPSLPPPLTAEAIGVS